MSNDTKKERLRKKCASVIDEDYKDFIIKIRNKEKNINNKDCKDKVEYDTDKVYYNGIKCFEIDENGNKKIADNILQFNYATIKNLFEEKRKNKENLSDSDIIDIIHNNRKKLMTYEINNKSKIILNLSQGIYKANNYEKNMEERLCLIKNDLKEYGLDKLSFVSDFTDNNHINKWNLEQIIEENKEIDLKNKNIKEKEKKIKNTNIKKEFCFSDDDVSLINKIKTKEKNIIEIIQLIFVKRCILDDNYSQDKKSGFRMPTFKFQQNEVVNFNNDKEFSKAIKATIEDYIKCVCGNKISEKFYQHQFMINKLDFYKELFAFEEEYYTQEGTDAKNIPDNEKNGRIDCIFLHNVTEGNKVTVDSIYLTELKINESVIEDPHGVLTHLKDIEKMLKSNKLNFISRLKKRIEDSLPYYECFSNKKIEVVDEPTLHFNTIIAYENNHKEECENKIDNIRESIITYLNDQRECKKHIYMHEYINDKKLYNQVNFENKTEEIIAGKLRNE